jgi:hypothetical protein
VLNLSYRNSYTLLSSPFIEERHNRLNCNVKHIAIDVEVKQLTKEPIISPYSTNADGTRRFITLLIRAH